MTEHQLLALVRLDFRRFRRGLLTVATLSLIGLAWLAVSGRFTLENSFALVVGLSMGPFVGIGLFGIRDRMEGTLALFASLPLKAERLAALRLASMALFVAPIALVDGTMIAIVLRDMGMPAISAPAALLATWIGLALVAGWCTAVAIAIPPSRASTTFSGIFLGFLACAHFSDPRFPTVQSVFEWLRAPGAPTILALAGTTAALILALGAWALTAYGIRNYTAEAEKPG